MVPIVWVNLNSLKAILLKEDFLDVWGIYFMLDRYSGKCFLV